MKYQHINDHTREFFEGWYLKHQKNDFTLSFIPGIHMTKGGEKHAFIQVITNDASYVIDYDAKDFYVSNSCFYLRIGKNIFSDAGAVIDINSPELRCKGKIAYGPFVPIRYDVMGPFSLLSSMQCNHGILSLCHTLHGSVTLGDETIDFDHGKGYIEKDWGYSFPKSYTWLQCNQFDDLPANQMRSVMVSAADIPLGKTHFMGLIAVVYDRDREYRIATYNGGRILLINSGELLIQRGIYRLHVKISKGSGNPLKAPVSGDMSRIIHERPCCSATFSFTQRGRGIFKAHSGQTSFESVLS